MSDFIKAQRERTKIALTPLLALSLNDPTARQDRADAVKKFIQSEDKIIAELHAKGAAGLTISGYRSALIDGALQLAFSTEVAKLSDPEAASGLAMIAVGGYGRGNLNPGSDIDILFLLDKPSTSKPKELTELIQNILYLLWDTGFKVGHATRTISECLAEAKAEQVSKTAMMDARLITGDKDLYLNFEDEFEQKCTLVDKEKFLNLRVQDRRSKHKKYSYTVFLQEPHVKESCGGLRDYHNILWITRVERNTRDLNILVKERLFTKRALREINEAFEFLHRVRNELHYHTQSSTDILTLRLQGIVATNFKYPQKSILRRCEAFMRDYYTHTRNIFNHTNSLIQMFRLEQKETEKRSWKRLFHTSRKRAKFDGFNSRAGLIYPENPDIFKDDSNRIFRMFQHCQIKGLHMSPQMRKLIKSQIENVKSKDFRYSRSNRETFRAMLERKGDVAMNLRRMHRVGALGAYLPEFGALDCLVQHEFFHRYTADEHTLRCIDQLDALLDTEDRQTEIYRQIFKDMEDPYAMYLALILHDTGRAENARDHVDGSALLASRVCTRLKISGGRRSLITFLVDHHLTFWKYATSRNLEDPAVIKEFAETMGTKQRLSYMLLFTYADSNGTNEEGWSAWKESLMLQLYRSTYQYLDEGKERYEESMEEDVVKLKTTIKTKLGPDFENQINDHFERMPKRYFRFRQPDNIASHIQTIGKFLEIDKQADHDRSGKLKWITRKDRGYTEIQVTCWNTPLLLEKICCALASEELSIISADVFTRTDNIVCDIIHVCTLDHQPITDKAKQKRVATKLKELVLLDTYDPTKYLKRKKNYLRKDPNEGAIPFPVRVNTNNYLSKTCTAVEIQALDRIALLHDLFYAIGKCKLATVHARICTEKGAAMDTIYVTYPDGSKVLDKEKLDELLHSIEKIIT